MGGRVIGFLKMLFYTENGRLLVNSTLLRCELCQQHKQHLYLFSALLHVAKVLGLAL